MRTNKFSIGWLIGIYVSSIVNEAIRTIPNFVVVVVVVVAFFLQKDFEHTKIRHKIKPTNKTKQN